MRIEVLGCSGSIGIPSDGTTSFLVDDDVLIDAGTGACRLTFERLQTIEHVFLTHTHLDHICALPFIVDTVGVHRTRPLKVYASDETVNSLMLHIFNNLIWPDFTKIPNATNPVLEFVIIDDKQVIEIKGRKFKPVSVDHTVQAFGYIVSEPNGCWAFSGDTHATDAFYRHLNVLEDLRFVIIESAFPNSEEWIADLSKHLCPSRLSQELSKLSQPCDIWITHLKPKAYDTIVTELQQAQRLTSAGVLQAGQVLWV